MIDEGKTTQRLVTVVPVCWGLPANNFGGMGFFFGQPLEDMTGEENRSLSHSCMILAEVSPATSALSELSGMCVQSKRMCTSSKQAGHQKMLRSALAS